MSIQIKRGAKKDLPQLKDGELAFCRDTKELYVGNNGNENVSVTKKVEDRLDAVGSQLEHMINDKIDYKEYCEILYNDDTVQQQQGACATDKYILIGLACKDDINSIIRVYDKDTFNFINEIRGVFYHINSITYDKLNDRVIIAHCISNGVYKNTISIIKSSELEKIKPTIENIAINNFSQIQTVTYGKNCYYVTSNDDKHKIFKLDMNFNLLSSFETNNTAVFQGINYYEGNLYVTRINIKNAGSINDELADINSSFIEVYREDGKYLRTYVIPIMTIGNEIEAFFHYDKGTFMGVWAGYKGTLITLSRVYESYYHRKEQVDIDYAWQSSVAEVYVDNTSETAFSSGSKTKPFKTLSQAMKYIYSNPTIQEVKLYIKGDHGSDNLDLKNKIFKIYGIENPIINNIYGKNSTIKIEGYINLKSNDRGLKLDGCNCTVLGININSTGSNSIYLDNSKLYFLLNDSTVSGADILANNSDIGLNTNLILDDNVDSVILRNSTIKYTVSLCENMWEKLKLERGSTAFNSGYNTIEYSTNGEFTGYNDGDVRNIRVNLNGRQVHLEGVAKPKKTLTSGYAEYLVAELPSNIKPYTEQYFVCQGTGVSKYLITIKKDCKIYISRYSTGTDNAEMNVNTWLPFSINYQL